jgi:hypothetical protein
MAELLSGNGGRPQFATLVLHHGVDSYRIESVKLEMQRRGPPRVAVFELDDGRFVAVEGVHRLTAAHQLGVAPTLMTLSNVDSGTLWTDVVGENFPGERDICTTTVGDMLKTFRSHVEREGTDLPSLVFTEFKVVEWTPPQQP